MGTARHFDRPPIRRTIQTTLDRCGSRPGIDYPARNEGQQGPICAIERCGQGHPTDEADSADESEYGESLCLPSETLATPMDQRNFYARIFRPAVAALKMEDVGWHSLRHTFASRLAMSGQTEVTIATLLRHSTNALVRRCAHLSPSHLRAAVETVVVDGKTADKRASISAGTGSETGRIEDVAEGNRTEAIEKIGAGDGI